MSVRLNLKNALINGDFSYWQRNITFTSIVNDQYFADRFHYIKSGTMVHNISRSTDVPSNAFGIYSMLVDCTTAQASILAGSYAGVLQHIEGNMLRSFKGKKMVLNFWVKATQTGTYCVALRNGTSTKAYVMEYTISTTNTWEKKTLRFTHDTTGTWSYDNEKGLTVVWVIAAGSTFQTTANTWVNGNFLATNNQVNGVSNTVNNFQLADICMVEDNEGQTRNPEFTLAGRDVFEELQLCQRYYEKNGISQPSNFNNHPSKIFWIPYASYKRITPIVDAFNLSSGVLSSIYQPGPEGFNIQAASTTSGNAFFFDWTADAEL